MKKNKLKEQCESLGLFNSDEITYILREPSSSDSAEKNYNVLVEIFKETSRNKSNDEEISQGYFYGLLRLNSPHKDTEFASVATPSITLNSLEENCSFNGLEFDLKQFTDPLSKRPDGKASFKVAVGGHYDALHVRKLDDELHFVVANNSPDRENVEHTVAFTKKLAQKVDEWIQVQNPVSSGVSRVCIDCYNSPKLCSLKVGEEGYCSPMSMLNAQALHSATDDELRNALKDCVTLVVGEQERVDLLDRVLDRYSQVQEIAVPHVVGHQTFINTNPGRPINI